MSYRYQTARSTKTWVVVADRSVARIFETDLAAPGDLKELQTLLFEESRFRPGEVLSDKAGTFLSDTGVRGAGDPRTDFRHRTARTFANDVTDLLDAGRCDHRFGNLVLIAPSFFLGTLRQKLNSELKSMVVAELEKELTHASAKDLGETVRRALQADGTELS